VPHRPRNAAAVVALTGLGLLAACEALPASPSGSPAETVADGAPARLADGGAAAGGVTASQPPGAGAVTGRLVDGVTGMPVVDAGVAVLGTRHRTLTGPDGGYRLEGLEPGVVTLVFGPADGYVPRSLSDRLPDDGLDAGVVALLPRGFTTLMSPEYGGRLALCGQSRIDIVTDALAEPGLIEAACVERPDEFPAPAPSGRLPLAVLDLAPADLTPARPPRLTVELPAQPRYAAGVPLDLLRLDLERLMWVPTAELTVDPGGQTASGALATLGTYMVVAPPFGAFAPGVGDQPTLSAFSILAGPTDIQPTSVFGTGREVVYAAFDFARMNNTPVMIRAIGPDGALRFELRRPYTDQGREVVPMVITDGATWPPGRYVTTLYIGDPPAAFASLEWAVAAAPTPTAPPPTLPPVVPPPATAPPIRAVAGAAAAAGCVPPYGWWLRLVQPGDTLSALAYRTNTHIEALARANCLSSYRLAVGQPLYLPQPPAKPRPPSYPAPTIAYPSKPPAPTYPTWRSPPGGGTAWPTLPAPTPTTKYATLGIPTTWYTPIYPTPGFTAPPTPVVIPTHPVQPPVVTEPPVAPPPQPTVALPPPAPPTSAPMEPPGGGPPAPPKETRPPDPTLAPRPTGGP
jgi:hypothetical protein